MEFWSIAGGPFEGKYRKASVLHDVACQVKKQTWRRVHRMFFDAMMCEGLPLKKALALYGAVYHFGPQWDDPEGFFERVGGVFANLYGIFRGHIPRRPPTRLPPPSPPSPRPPFPRSPVDPKPSPPLSSEPSPLGDSGVSAQALAEQIEALIDELNLTTPEQVERLQIR
jgi:hypothetical protein